MSATHLFVRHALAISHVERGRAIVARQRGIIRDLGRLNLDTSLPEELPARFEKSLATFEDDLREIEDRG